MKKTIAVFTITYHPFVGGAEVALKEIMHRSQGYDFVVFTARLSAELPEEEQYENVRLIRVGSGGGLDKYLFAFRAAHRAIHMHKKNAFCFAWAMMANYAGLAAYLFTRRIRIPYLLTLQSGDSESFILSRTWFWLPLYKQIYRRARKIQSISSSLEKRARAFGYKGDISIIPNGVDLQSFRHSFSQQDLSGLRSKLGITDSDTVIITTSRLVLKNAISDLVKAINTLHFKMGISAVLLVIGDGKDRSKLERLAQQQGVAQWVHFLGYKDQQDLPRYFAISHIFCRPSLSEGLGNSFLESMAMGVPIIGTPVGGIVDFLFDGETGLYCKPGKPYTIAEAVERYFKNNELYTKISLQGIELILQKYDWKMVADQMNALFVELHPKA